jgi:hypothetical protein
VAAFVHAHRGNRLSQDLDALPAHQLRAARQLDAIQSQLWEILKPGAGEGTALGGGQGRRGCATGCGEAG